MTTYISWLVRRLSRWFAPTTSQFEIDRMNPRDWADLPHYHPRCD